MYTITAFLRNLFARVSTPSIIRWSGCGACMLLVLSIVSCGKEAKVPASYSQLNEPSPIYPDYRSITIPVNIAPLNVWVQDTLASDIVLQIGDMVVATDSRGKTDIDMEQWHSLLAQNAGRDLLMYVYAERPQGWVRYSADTLHVAEEPIDSFLSYRLIEPGYELYRQMGLYQRDLTSFDVQTICENNRTYDDEHNHCINCHNYQAYDTERMLFHVRAQHGGTMLIDNGNVRKIAIRHDSILAAGVYPSWHPTMQLVAFSTNKTGQVFHLQHPEKIEVLDEASDLLLYNVKDNSVRHILRTDSCLETFPCWSPDGTRLYFCSARVPDLGSSHEEHELVMHYDSLFYNIYSMSFDSVTCNFGEPQLEVDAASEGRSASVPRISPDGRWLLYTLGHYGQFHIWHKGAELWVKEIASPLPPQQETDQDKADEGLSSSAPIVTNRPLFPNGDHAPSAGVAASGSSPSTDSYHTWSSNGRWIVFSSRRDDGNFTRPYIAYFDSTGRAHRAFILPQRDPESNIMLLKSYNVPELTRNRVHLSAEQLQKAIIEQQAITAKFIP